MSRKYFLFLIHSTVRSTYQSEAESWGKNNRRAKVEMNNRMYSSDSSLLGHMEYTLTRIKNRNQMSPFLYLACEEALRRYYGCMTWEKIKAVVGKRSEVRCKPQQVWWAYIGENIGKEQNGKGEQFLRPVIVIQSISRKLCFVLPLTSKQKKGRVYVPIAWKRLNSAVMHDCAIISQARVISTKRLIKIVGNLESIESFRKLIKRCYSILLSITNSKGTT